jgi:hypothetical protein
MECPLDLLTINASVKSYFAVGLSTGSNVKHLLTKLLNYLDHFEG